MGKRIYFLSAIFLLISGSVFAQPVQFIRQFGSTGLDVALSVITDSSSNIFVCGFTGGALPGQTNSGSQDAFLCKYDINGNVIWIKQFGSSTNQFFGTEASDIVLDSFSNVYLCGKVGFNGSLPGQTSSGGTDAFVRKYNTNGTEIWTRQFGAVVNSNGNDEDMANCITLDNIGNIYVGGYTKGSFPGQTSAHEGNPDIFIRKYDASGNELWTKQFGCPGEDVCLDVKTDSSGEVYICGFVSGALPGQSWAGDFDAFIRKYSSGGTELWTKQFGTDSGDDISGIAIDSSGNICIGAITMGTMSGQSSAGYYDCVVGKFDASGTELWIKQFGSTTYGYDAISDLAIDDFGNIYLSGSTNQALVGQTSAGHYDAFICKYDTNGNKLWTYQFGTGGDDYGRSISVDGLGNIYICGYAGGSLFGQPIVGGWDAYIAKFGYYSIKGYITDSSNAGITGTKVTLSGASTEQYSVFASSGYYEFVGLSTGSYTVTPEKSGYTFTPVSRSTASIANNINNWNFTGSLSYSIKGHTKNEAGSAISGATISLSGSATKAASTDASGYYEFLNLFNRRIHSFRG